MIKIITSIIIWSSLIIAQVPGSLSGTIKDKASGEGLPGVNIVLKGTYYGAATDINGRYNIPSINPGNYTVEISLIGYKTVQFTGIQIVSNQTKKIDVELEETVLTLGQDVVVVGEQTHVDARHGLASRRRCATLARDERLTNFFCHAFRTQQRRSAAVQRAVQCLLRTGDAGRENQHGQQQESFAKIKHFLLLVNRRI